MSSGDRCSMAEALFVIRCLLAVVFQYGFELRVGEHPAFKALTAGLIQYLGLIFAAQAHDGGTEPVIDLLRLVGTLGIEHFPDILPTVLGDM